MTESAGPESRPVPDSQASATDWMRSTRHWRSRASPDEERPFGQSSHARSDRRRRAADSRRRDTSAHRERRGSRRPGRRRVDPLEGLTPREREILGLIAEGRSNQGICRALWLSPKTVETHIRGAFAKLGIKEAPEDNRRVLAVLAYLRR